MYSVTLRVDCSAKAYQDLNRQTFKQCSYRLNFKLASQFQARVYSGLAKKWKWKRDLSSSETSPDLGTRLSVVNAFMCPFSTWCTSMPSGQNRAIISTTHLLMICVFSISNDLVIFGCECHFFLCNFYSNTVPRISKPIIKLWKG